MGVVFLGTFLERKRGVFNGKVMKMGEHMGYPNSCCYQWSWEHVVLKTAAAATSNHCIEVDFNGVFLRFHGKISYKKMLQMAD